MTTFSSSHKLLIFDTLCVVEQNAKDPVVFLTFRRAEEVLLPLFLTISDVGPWSCLRVGSDDPNGLRAGSLSRCSALKQNTGQRAI